MRSVPSHRIRAQLSRSLLGVVTSIGMAERAVIKSGNLFQVVHRMRRGAFYACRGLWLSLLFVRLVATVWTNGPTGEPRLRSRDRLCGSWFSMTMASRPGLAGAPTSCLFPSVSGPRASREYIRISRLTWLSLLMIYLGSGSVSCPKIPVRSSVSEVSAALVSFVAFCAKVLPGPAFT